MTTSVKNNTVHDMIRSTGARVTSGRVSVLGLLLESRRALTHLEIEEALPEQLDRVTLYRILDWLVAEGLAHRISSDDRVWRFSVENSKHQGHAHFQCSDCGKVVCLEQAGAPKVRLPKGYRMQEMDLTVKGHCAACNHH